MRNNIPLYLQFAGRLENQIRSNVFKTGDKLPSIRQVCAETGYSMSTVSKAYYELESRSLIRSQPQSGYFVTLHPAREIPIPETSSPLPAGKNTDRQDIIDKVYLSMKDPEITMLSLGAPADALLPIAKLNKGMLQAIRQLPDSGTAYDDLYGNPTLRREIARLSYTWQGALSHEDVITTAGCMNALSFCLLSLTNKGDTILVESPVYFGVLQLAHALGLYVMEVPSSVTTGIELDAVKKALATGKIKVCLLISNFSNPSGSLMPNTHKKEVVKLMDHYNVPLIEDDIYGDLYFGNQRPNTCKTYDESGIVLYCSSVSKTLAPGYRVGWISPGRFKKEILRTKLYHSMSATSITHEVVSDFLRNGRYENHLRKLRQTLSNNCSQYINTISEYFPAGTKVTRPEGGLFLWLELDKSFDSDNFYNLAMKYKISIAPGRLFSLQDQFSNCMRLNFAIPWSGEHQDKLRLLGKLSARI